MELVPGFRVGFCVIARIASEAWRDEGLQGRAGALISNHIPDYLCRGSVGASMSAERAAPTTAEEWQD